MKTNVQFELEYQESDKAKPKPHYFSAVFEFISVAELFSDVERVLYETVKEKLEEKCVVGSTVVIAADVFGVTLSNGDAYTEDYDKRKKKKEVDIDSLKNDIQYANSVLASAGDIDVVQTAVQPDESLGEAFNIIHEGRKWIYHIMNKHFDEPIPEGFEPDKPVESKPA